MKIFFIRHGEAMDDLENKYGGWYDPQLSPKGRETSGQAALQLEDIAKGAGLILSSPLKRALETAEIINQKFNLPIETSVYLKERNTYGLLCGENKDEAKRKYPELVAAYDNSEEVLGYESYDFFLKRVMAAVEKLKELKQEIIICVTHGKFLGAFFKDVLGKPAKEFHDNCIAEITLDGQARPTFINSWGIDF